MFWPAVIDTPELMVRGVGVREPMRARIIDRLPGTPEYLFMYFYQSIRIGIDASAPEQPPSTLMIWEPGIHQVYGNQDEPWEHTWLRCDGSLVPRWVSENGLHFHRPFRIESPSLIEAPLLELHAELTDPRVPDSRIVQNLVENWLRRIGRMLRTPAARTGVPDALRDAKHYMDTNYQELIRLQDLATIAGLSVSHFCAEFKRRFGIAPIQYLIRIRIQRACDLLNDRNLRIGEIAAMVGYEDTYHFSKLFKKHCHISPQEMRRSIAETGPA